ncbi:MAG: Hpt domain-containing protein [bacterium]
MNNGTLPGRLRDAFAIEAKDRIDTLMSGLQELEMVLSSPERQTPFLEMIFREAHGLKGAARVVNLVDIENCCQHAEDLAGGLKRGESPLSAETFDRLAGMVRSIRDAVNAFEKDRKPVRGVA